MPQEKLISFNELHKLSIELQLMNLEMKRKEKYEELCDDIAHLENIDDKKYLIKVYLYETRKIDAEINNLRILMLKK